MGAIKQIMKAQRLSLFFVEASGFGVSIMGAVAILGYLFNLPVLYTWNAGAGMALPTALALTSLGISAVILAFIHDWPVRL